MELCSFQTVVQPPEKVVQPHALSLHLHPAPLTEGGRGADIVDDPLTLTPAPAHVAPPPHHLPLPAQHLALQKDGGFITGVQRAVRVRRPPAAPFPAHPLGATDCLTPHRDAADQDPDRGHGPGPRPGPRPDPGHHPHAFPASSGKMFTAAESPGGSGGSTR